LDAVSFAEGVFVFAELNISNFQYLSITNLAYVRTTIAGCAGVQAFVVKYGEDSQPREVVEMLWTIFVILLVLWLVGLVSSYTLGGFIHLLLVAAVVVLILQLISGRRPVV
jgi:Family of unknown function (DUF5670)